MYRLLKDLLDWKVNLFIKCKLGKRPRQRYEPVFVFVITSYLLVSNGKCVESLSQKGNERSSNHGRTLDHGLFRHDDKPFNSISPFPPRSDTSVKVDETVSSTSTSSYNSDRYNSYDRFKRSVTSLNFHPKGKNLTKNVGLKPMRIFKYVTEEDVLVAPSHESRHNPHITVFHPLVSKVKRINHNNHSNSDTEDLSNDSTPAQQRVVGGAKINLKAKLDKVISVVNEANKNDTESGSDLKGNENLKSTPSLSPSKPENILIFKPTLAIRKNANNRNKTSLIPSGKYISKFEGAHNHAGDEIDEVKPTNNIEADTRRKSQQQQQEEKSVHKESADPNSSSVNDRSLIQPNLYFDSVVMLSAEGQKQLERVQHRERTSDDGNAEATTYSTGENEDKNSKIKNEMEAAPSSSSMKSIKANDDNDDEDGNGASTTSSDKSGKNNPKKKISPSLEKENGKNGNTTTSFSKKWTNKNFNGTITSERMNKDKVVYKVVAKSSKQSNKTEKYSKKSLILDDTEEDGSERLRRSPFHVPMSFQKPSHAFLQRNAGPGHELARAALFSVNNARVTRLRHAPVIKKKVMPRLIAPLPGRKSIRKNPHLQRAILPMKPMKMMKSPVPNLALMPGPIGPGPVGPPIAAIKVTHLNLNNMKNINNNNQNGKTDLNKFGSTNNGQSSFIPTGVQSSHPTGPMSNLHASGPSAPGKLDLIADASKTTLSFKPLPDDVLLNQAASSYYSPTYKKFKKRFQNHLSSIRDTERNILDVQRELEDGGLSRWEESRYPSSRHSSHKSRHRNGSSRRDHSRRNHHHDGFSNSHHSRSGQHSHLPRHRSPSRGKKLSGAKYTYPKNAENIQDILKYFDDKSGPHLHRGGERSESSFDKSGLYSKKRHGHGHHHHSASALPDRHESSLPSHPKLADLSGEFRDVHASLLKDIREFAKRPHLFKPSSSAGSDHADSKLRSHIDSHEMGNPFDPIDEIFGPDPPKPVRELIKPDLYSLENIRERIALKQGKLRGRPKDKDYHSNGDDHRDRDRDRDNFRNGNHGSYNEGDDFYDSHRPSRHNSENDRSAEQYKNLFHSKEDYDNPSTYSKNKYKESGDDSHPIFPSNHYHSRKDSSHSSSPFDYQSGEFPSTKAPFSNPPRKPQVLKRPSEPYRFKNTEPKKKPEHDYFWNSELFRKGFEKPPTPVTYDAPLVIKSPVTPSVLHPYNPYSPYGPASAATQALPKPVSVEDEDIVEIHTGHPHSHPMHTPTAVPSFQPPSPHDAKQEKLKKMYMDVLQQKMQIEAALMRPQTSPVIQTPTVQFNHAPMTHTLHTSASLLPQHSPLTMPRVPHQITYPASPTLSPLTGLLHRRKKPMRMKIHIYPNGHDGLEQSIEAANLLASGGFGTSGFSASNPPGVVAPPPTPKDMSVDKAPEISAIPSGPTGGPLAIPPSGYGGSSISGPSGPVNVPTKNKNVVLHLHVHRRNDMLGPLELETEGSNPVPQATKPINFKEIFDETLKPSEEEHIERKNKNLANHRLQDEADPSSHSAQDTTQERDPHEEEHVENDDSRHNEERDRDKSEASMEAPIHDEKIEDVFHTIMKLRKKVDNRKKRS